MNRVKWKGPYIKTNLLKKINSYDLALKNNIKTMSKNSTILPKFVGITFKIYNGKTFVILKIVEEMIGHKLGEFISTRKQYFYKNK